MVAVVVVAAVGYLAYARAFASPESHLLSISTPVCGEPAARGHEPHLTVDPHSPSHLAVSWTIQGGLGAAVSVTRDGGHTWGSEPVVGLTACDSSVEWGDTWSSIGADGTLYVSALGFRFDSNEVLEGVAVSHDGGYNWDRAATLEELQSGDQSLDRSSVQADPKSPGQAVAAWAYYFPNTEPAPNAVHVARTTDWGATWSSPQAAASSPTLTFAPQVMALAPGHLISVYGKRSVTVQNTVVLDIFSIESSDGGLSWGAPVRIARFQTGGLEDPENYVEIRADGATIPIAGAGRNLYVCWADSVVVGTSTMWMAASRDGGRTWTSPRKVLSQKSQVFLPEIAVAGDGTVGILWYDFENFQRGSGQLATDVWLSTSKDGGRSWSRRHIAGSFDMRQAIASDRGPFLGDYMGVVGLPHGFGASFVLSPPGARKGEDYVYFATVTD